MANIVNDPDNSPEKHPHKDVGYVFGTKLQTDSRPPVPSSVFLGRPHKQIQQAEPDCYS